MHKNIATSILGEKKKGDVDIFFSELDVARAWDSH